MYMRTPQVGRRTGGVINFCPLPAAGTGLRPIFLRAPQP
jgi:hypothetical protein